MQRNSSKPNLREMEEFYQDAAAGPLSTVHAIWYKLMPRIRTGSLPNFTFIEPRINPNPKARHSASYGLANHQHPTASVMEGERWIKNIYEAVRNGPLWEKTLLIFTYDEHGVFPCPAVLATFINAILWCDDQVGFTIMSPLLRQAYPLLMASARRCLLLLTPSVLSLMDGNHTGGFRIPEAWCARSYGGCFSIYPERHIGHFRSRGSKAH